MQQEEQRCWLRVGGGGGGSIMSCSREELSYPVQSHTSSYTASA